MQRICVYCGCSDRIPDRYLPAATGLGQALAKRDITLVFGGGRTGLMGELADAVLRNHGKVIGVIPEIFNTPALVHNALTELRVVPDMHTRKSTLIDLADGFIALPGGYGTFEELFETLTWAQIGLHQCPIGLLNAEGYFDPMIVTIEHAMTEGFIYHEHRGVFLVERDPNLLLDRMLDYRPPPDLEQWLTREEVGG